MNTVKIDRITYAVLDARNADQMEAAGFPRVAQVMRQNNIKLDLNLKRPNGQKVFHAIQWTNGVYSTPVKIGL